MIQRRHTGEQQVHETMLNIANIGLSLAQSPNIRDMQIKTVMIRMAIIKTSRNNECWRGCGEKGALLHC